MKNTKSIIMLRNGFTFFFLFGLIACQQASSVSVNKKIEEPRDATMKKQQVITFIATVKHFDFEGGFYGLLAADGHKWLPLNLKQDYKNAGDQLEVTGYEEKDMMTIQQWGKPFTITKVKLIKKGTITSNRY
jgi:hypothetical protein